MIRSIPALIFVCCGTAIAASPPSLEGKWRLNLAESELFAGEEPPAELVMAITRDDGKSFRWTVTVRMRDGQSGSLAFDGAIDGRPRPVVGRPGSTSSFAWMPDGTLKQVSQSAQGLAVELCAFSPTWRKMTCETRQTDSSGRAASSREVFDRL